jgi:hypothetical protein
MNKKFISLCFGTLFLFVVSCKKESNVISNSIEGLWELRRASGMFSTAYPPGNGHIIKFTDNNYEISVNGQITQSGRYSIVPDSTAESATCLVIPAGQYTNRIIYDNNVTAKKVFIEISGNSLVFLSGCFAYDAGSSSEYARQ